MDWIGISLMVLIFVLFMFLYLVAVWAYTEGKERLISVLTGIALLIGGVPLIVNSNKRFNEKLIKQKKPVVCNNYLIENPEFVKVGKEIFVKSKDGKLISLSVCREVKD